MTAPTLTPTTLACMASSPKNLDAHVLSDALLQASLVLADAQRLEEICSTSLHDIPRAIADLVATVDPQTFAFPKIWAILLDGLGLLQASRSGGVIPSVVQPELPTPGRPQLATSNPAPAPRPRRPLKSAGDLFRKDPGAYLPFARRSPVLSIGDGMSPWAGFVDVRGETMPWCACDVWPISQQAVDAVWAALVTRTEPGCVIVGSQVDDGVIVPAEMQLVIVPGAIKARVYPLDPSVA